MTNEASDDEILEHVHHSTTAPLHVPLHPLIEKPVKFSKFNLKSVDGQINKPNQLRATVEPEPEGMKNHLIFEQNLKYFRYFGAILGADLEFHWKIGLKFIFTCFLLVLMISQLTYTQYLHIKSQNYYRILETIAMYGITVSMILKLWAFLKYFKALKALHNSSINLCKSNDNGFRGAKIRNRLQYNSRFYKWTSIVVMASLLIYTAYPIKAFFVDHELISLLPVEYMFVDSSTNSGFFTANIISSVLGCFAAVATSYMILILVSIFLNYSVFVDMFEEDMKSLDEMWSRPTDTTVTYRHSFLRNICRKQQDMNAYVVEVKRVLDDYIFYYFIASYLGQIICLFQIVVSDWKSGYAVAYGMFMEMMCYCLMGTKIKTENERIVSALQQSKWYTYDIHSQKVFLNLWRASVNAKEMRIGPLAPLSVTTGTDVVKSIFTYFNVLLGLV